jgi:hypothetical protein
MTDSPTASSVRDLARRGLLVLGQEGLVHVPAVGAAGDLGSARSATSETVVPNMFVNLA